MALKGVSLFNGLYEKLRFLDARNARVARNIQNANTPRFEATDLATPSFKDLFHKSNKSGGQGDVTRTHMNHLPGNGPTPSAYESFKIHNPNGPTPNGNTVDLQYQHMLLADINQQHEMATKALVEFHGMLDEALRR